MKDGTLTGRCLCGATSYTIVGKLQREVDQITSCFCHCRMCQRASSAPVIANVGFDKIDVKWNSRPSEYESSSRARRLFCR